jgi:hypothetical protein
MPCEDSGGQLEGRTAQLATRRLRSSVAVIRAHSGIDASNADTLTEYTLTSTPNLAWPHPGLVESQLG